MKVRLFHQIKYTMKKSISLIIVFFCSLSLSAQIVIRCDSVKCATKPHKDVSYVRAIEMRIGGPFEACEYKLRKDRLIPADFHPFVATLLCAFIDHRPVSISPDMIWLMICQGFSMHLKQNAEELRDKMVGFENKKKLIVNTLPISSDFIKGSEKTPWPLAFDVMSDSIAKYVNPKIFQVFDQTFSTTTAVEKAAFDITLMDAVSGYFEYEVFTACDIPVIKIEGTRNDWVKIKKNVRQLKGYEIDYWIKALEPILQKFIDVFDHKTDKTFWNNIFKYNDESGGPYITGWIIKFFPYISEGKDSFIKNPYIEKEPVDFGDGLKTNQFCSGLSKTDFIWEYYKKHYEMELMAGFVGIRQDTSDMTLRPEIGWVVKDKHASKKENKKEDEKTKNENKISEGITYIIYAFAIIVVLAIFLILYRNLRKR